MTTSHQGIRQSQLPYRLAQQDLHWGVWSTQLFEEFALADPIPTDKLCITTLFTNKK